MRDERVLDAAESATLALPPFLSILCDKRLTLNSVLHLPSLAAGGECGVPYERRLPMPTPGPDQPWYAFDWGPVHFLQYSTEHPFAVGTPQHDFILRDLKGVDRRR